MRTSKIVLCPHMHTHMHTHVQGIDMGVCPSAATVQEAGSGWQRACMLSSTGVCQRVARLGMWRDRLFISLLGIPSLFSGRFKIKVSLPWFLTKAVLAEDNHCHAMSS